MKYHKRSSLALSAVALAVVASIVACAVPGQGAQPIIPPTLALPTSLPIVTLAPPDTSTPVPTDTEAPTQTAVVITATPLPIPTATSTPFALVTVPPASVVTFSSVTRSTNALYSDGPCAPISVEFSVIVTPLSNFAYVDLYTGLPWFGSPYERWDSGTRMNNNPGSAYFWKSITHETINSRDFVTPEARPVFDSAPLSYQFVAMDRYGKVMGRSPVYSNITYYQCK